ncbi:Y-family DNA polymerase [Beutenbergia cavernae]|nr:DNA polymerase Y family protein [Beutenbergia cavernae]
MSALTERRRTAARTAELAPRLAVLWVPDWPVAAAVLSGAAPAHAPIAVHDSRVLTAVDARARSQGVRRGMRRRTAQGLCPDLELVAMDEGRDVRAFEPVVQAVEGVVAGVEVSRPGLVVLAAGGPSRYVGTEEALAELLVGTVADEAGTECQVGVADGLLAALLAARDGLIVPPGTSAEYLAGRPVRDLLHVATTRESHARLADLSDLLRRLGIGTLGAFARLRAGDVLARFGDVGTQGYRLARGLDARPVSVRRPEPDVTVRADLDPPAARLDTAAFAARRLAEDLQNRLLRRGAVCARLRVLARTEGGSELVRTWRIDGAATATELTDRVRWQLEGWLNGRSGQAPSAPLVRLELVAEEVTPAGTAQDGLWGRRSRGEQQAGRAALRVQGLLGSSQVLTPVLEGGRSPRDQVRLVAWGDEAVGLRPPEAPWPGRIPRPLPATVPDVPWRAELTAADGGPVTVGGRGTLVPAGVVPALLRILPEDGEDAARTSGRGQSRRMRSGSYRITGWAGPWPIGERWWQTTGARSGAYVQLLLDGAPGVLVVVRDGRWWVEGVYD